MDKAEYDAAMEVIHAYEKLLEEHPMFVREYFFNKRARLDYEHHLERVEEEAYDRAYREAYDKAYKKAYDKAYKKSYEIGRRLGQEEIIRTVLSSDILSDEEKECTLRLLDEYYKKEE
ncbi:MAG: hypothetical protein IJS28_08900 [Synergistaceae bacterium]|nr:hypothetical protein [Synergistaceae bacterium]